MPMKVQWNSHSRVIIVQCLLIVIPMVASSIVIAYIVYVNRVDQRCISQELCPGLDTLNSTDQNHYYVDFPAARLALISSATSTISFTLVGILMAIQAYSNAASLLRASERADHEALPSPMHFSIILRLLNAEWIALWNVISSKLWRVFGKQEKDIGASSQTPSLVKSGALALAAGIMASFMIQVADIYFHVAAQSSELVQIQSLGSTNYQFSRSIAPWCLNRPTVSRDFGPKNYYGCAITARPAPNNNATSVAPTNATVIQDMKNSVSDEHQTISFTESTGAEYAIVGPAKVNDNLDWKASSFGVSTTCSAIPDGACGVSSPIVGAKNAQGNPMMLVPFNCTREATGIDLAGNLTSQNTATHMLNFHKYAAESPPFFPDTLVDLEDFNIVRQMINSGEDADEVLKNNWNVFVMRKIPSAVQGDFSQLPPSFNTSEKIWKHDLLGAFVLLNCNVTVWDLTYTSIGSSIAVVSKAPSNGSTAGIASMPGTRFIGTLSNVFQDESTGPFSRSSPENFIKSFETGMSKAYSYPLASQLSGQPSLLVQTRTSKVITKLPISALWLLITANIAYAFLGLIIGFYALMRATEEAGQVQLRLGVPGLVAILFDREHSGKHVGSTEELFKEIAKTELSDPKKIGVMNTKEGGSHFLLFRHSRL